MRFSQKGEGLDNLFLISMSKDLLKKMKVKYGAGIFYNKAFEGFARKEKRID